VASIEDGNLCRNKRHLFFDLGRLLPKVSPNVLRLTHWRWKFLVSGDPVVNARRAALAATNVWDITIDSEVWHCYLSRHCECSPVASQAKCVLFVEMPRKASAPIVITKTKSLEILHIERHQELIDQALSVHVPGPLQTKLSKNHLCSYELRWVTVMAVNIRAVVNWNTGSLGQRSP
jgi:hypothetical protein